MQSVQDTRREFVMWPLVGSLPNILVNKVLYNYLLKYDPDTLAPRGDLAESWEVSGV